MRILVTGADGYIGILLSAKLLERGCYVIGLDTGFYRDGWLYGSKSFRKFPILINKDIRHITERDLEGIDAVVHLAELSNDPLGQNNPEVTYKINHLASVELAKKCKNVGIRSFIYTSSCSVYGIGKDNEIKSEASETNPQTAYARCKVLVERDISKLADSDFSPTFLRNATAYGPSPRMRFDIVLNNLFGIAWTTGKIVMVSDGTPWRPLVHVLDICDAIICVLEAPREQVHNQIFNVGNNEDNLQVKDIAQIVADTLPDCELVFGKSNGDNRSYRVSFEKIHDKLPDFKCKRNPVMGAQQLKELFLRIKMTCETFKFRAFTRLTQLEYLLHTKQVNTDLFWNN